MNLVFLNSFERKGEHDERIEAQVSIAEERGEWKIWWNESGRDGRNMSEIWYTGTAWRDMIAEFRRYVADKLESGFRPMIDMPPVANELGSGKMRFLRKLECYGERNVDEELYEALRRWRNAQASNEGKTPFIVASNRQLKMICAFLPRTVEELRQIPGFGEQKTRLYGEDIVKLASRKERQTSFPLDWVDGAIDDSVLEMWWEERQEQRRKGESARQEQMRLIRSLAAEGSSLTDLEAVTGLARRELVTRLEQLHKEGFDVGPLLDAELGGVSEQLLEQALGLFRSLGDRFLRPVLQQLYDEKKLDEAALAEAYEWLRLARIQFRSGAPALEEAAGAAEQEDGEERSA